MPQGKRETREFLEFAPFTHVENIVKCLPPPIVAQFASHLQADDLLFLEDGSVADY